MSRYGDFSGSYFPALELNTERYGVSLCSQSKCGKILTRKNSLFGYFSRREMWSNPQETADLFNLPKKSLMENYI